MTTGDGLVDELRIGADHPDLERLGWSARLPITPANCFGNPADGERASRAGCHLSSGFKIRKARKLLKAARFAEAAAPVSRTSAFVYRVGTDGTVLLLSKLATDDGFSYQSFGSAVAIGGPYGFVLVGVKGDDDKGSQSGSAYVYGEFRTVSL